MAIRGVMKFLYQWNDFLFDGFGMWVYNGGRGRFCVEENMAKENKNLFGRSAINAVKLFTSGKEKSVNEAWQSAIEKETSNENTQKKPCPKCTFLGLCEVGLVKGIPKDNYLKGTSIQKEYAINAVNALKDNPSLCEGSIQELWHIACGDENKKHNSQMNVVVSLFKNALLNLE